MFLLALHPYVFSLKPSYNLLHFFFLSLSTSSLNDAHPLAVKLNKLIEDGKIPESCIYYKFLNDTMSLALTDPKTASGFKWDDEVCEFFSTIKYLGGERTRKFVRGPGFFGTGRGGEKEFKSFADFNLCGPSLNATKRCQSGYTTESGMIKPHLQSLHSLCQQLRPRLITVLRCPWRLTSNPNLWLEKEYFLAWKIVLEPYKPVKIAWKVSEVLNTLWRVRPQIV